MPSAICLWRLPPRSHQTLLVDATIAALNEKGVPTFAKPFNYEPVQHRLAFFLDNNGNAIEFSGPLTNE